MPYKDPEKVKQSAARSRKKNAAQRAAYNKQYALDHPEEMKARRADHNRRPHNRFKRAVKKAAKRELTWLLTLEEYTLLIKQPCHYCNNEFGTTVGMMATGLDRLDNSRGYEMDNVVSCCYECNTMRSYILSPEELRIAVRSLIDYRKTKI
jgi:hypothetical protein